MAIRRRPASVRGRERGTELAQHHHHGHHRAQGAAAYQQVADPTQPSTVSQGLTTAPDARTTALDVVEQVLAQDLGTPSVTG